MGHKWGMNFSDRYIDNLKPRDKEYRVAEARGFCLRVRPSGIKIWTYRYRHAERDVMLTLGHYPDMTLADARTAHAAAWALHKRGVDPAEAKRDEVRRQAEAAKEKAGKLTVNKLIDYYIVEYAKKKKRSWEADKRSLEKDLSPGYGDRPIEEITRRDIVLICKAVEKRGAPRQARILYNQLHKMFRFALREGLIESSPCSDIEPPGHNGHKKKRPLTATEIATVWPLLDKRMDRSTARALRMILVTGQRPGECLGMMWEEVKGRWWTIPAARVKTKQEQRVYLTDLAIEIMGKKKTAGPVFPAPKLDDDGQPKLLGEKSTGRAVYRLFKPAGRHQKPIEIPPFTPHDLRHTAATICGEAGWKNYDLDLLLNHANTSMTARYNHAAYDTERKGMAETIERVVREILEKVADCHAGSHDPARSGDDAPLVLTP